MDIAKLKSIEERMRAVLNEEKPLIEFSALAKQTGLWQVVEEGSSDEACVISIGACTFIEEDDSSMALEDCSEKALAKEEDSEATHIIDALEQNGPSPKLSKVQMLDLKKAILNIKADFLIQLRFALWEGWSTRIEKRMQQIGEEFPGFKYLKWEDLNHYVSIDGQRYRMDHWYDHELERTEDGKTIAELEKASVGETRTTTDQ